LESTKEWEGTVVGKSAAELVHCLNEKEKNVGVPRGGVEAILVTVIEGGNRGWMVVSRTARKAWDA